MAATIDATLQGASANSYVTLAEANSYFQTVPHDEQLGRQDDKKNRANYFSNNLVGRADLLRHPLHHNPSTEMAAQELQSRRR